MRTEAAKRARIKYRQKESTKKREQGYDYKRKYGITKEEFHDVLSTCGGLCPICDRPFDPEIKTEPVLDHCHNSKTLRGVICMNCNTAIGHAKNNVETLKNMIKYLESEGC